MYVTLTITCLLCDSQACKTLTEHTFYSQWPLLQFSYAILLFMVADLCSLYDQEMW